MKLRVMIMAASVASAAFVAGGEPTADGRVLIAVPDVAAIRPLPVTTGAIGNTLVRGNTFADPTQTFMQLYTGDMAVGGTGHVFLTTAWEEGLRAAGVYKDGDALPEVTRLGVNSGETVTCTDRHVAYARWLNTREGRKNTLVLFRRLPGGGIESGRNVTVYLENRPHTIVGLAIDEQRDRIYFADADGVHALSLAKHRPVTDFDVTLARGGRLCLDDAGNVFVAQRAQPNAVTQTAPLAAEPFGSPPLDAEHAVENAVGGGKVSFRAADAAHGWIGLDFGRPTAVACLRIHGDVGGEAGYKDVKVQVSAEGRDGPWTDVAGFADRAYGWPEEWITLDPSRPIRCVRVVGPAITMQRMEAQGPVPEEPGGVHAFAPDGSRLPLDIEAIPRPTDIAWDAPRQRLLVADEGPDHQVHAFRRTADGWRRDDAFGTAGRLGVRGGLRAGTGAERGTVGDLRFQRIRGVGCDDAGNVFVCYVGDAGMCQTRLESYTPAGGLRWRLEGTSFLDQVDDDPAATGDLFSTFNRYRVDRAKPASSDWEWVASTVDRGRFPDDPRLNGSALVYGVRRLHGRRFLVTTTQHGRPLNVLRFTDDDQAAIPSGVLSFRTTGAKWPPHQPAGFGPFIWRDADGDGQFAAAEYDKVRRVDGDVSFMNMDDAGDVWCVVNRGSKRFLKKLALAEALDAHGSPVWSWDSPANREWPIPAPLDSPKSRIGGFEVDGSRGEVFLFGFPADQPGTCGHNWPLGRLVLRCRLDDDQLTVTHEAALLHDVVLDEAPKDQAYAAALGGEYLFVMWQQHFTVLVYRRDTLDLVGRLDMGPQCLKPLVDGASELCIQPDGEGFVLYSPHYVANAVHERRWNGRTAGWMPAPDLQAAAKGEDRSLNWPAADVEQWLVERRVLRPAGWGPWEAAATLPAATTAWSDPDTASPTAAYRLRSVGREDARSDWSRTVYFRPSAAAATDATPPERP
jgi:hypothetical protein